MGGTTTARVDDLNVTNVQVLPIMMFSRLMFDGEQREQGLFAPGLSYRAAKLPGSQSARPAFRHSIAGNWERDALLGCGLLGGEALDPRFPRCT